MESGSKHFMVHSKIVHHNTPPLAACPETAESHYTPSPIQAPGAYTYARHPYPLYFLSLVHENPVVLSCGPFRFATFKIA